MQAKVKLKKCRVCKKDFTPYKTTQIACDFKCAVIYAKQQAEKEAKKKAQAERRYIKEQKEKLKTKSQWLNEAQAVFNAYIRERDKDEPCISCGTTNPVQFCAGHYRSRGAAPELRFSEFNVHKQCNKNCNLEKSGNIGNYRIALLKKIGQKNLDWVEGHHELQKITIEDAKEIKAYYKEQLKFMKAHNIFDDWRF